MFGLKSKVLSLAWQVLRHQTPTYQPTLSSLTPAMATLTLPWSLTASSRDPRSHTGPSPPPHPRTTPTNLQVLSDSLIQAFPNHLHGIFSEKPGLFQELLVSFSYIMIFALLDILSSKLWTPRRTGPGLFVHSCVPSTQWEPGNHEIVWHKSCVACLPPKPLTLCYKTSRELGHDTMGDLKQTCQHY